MYSLDSPHLCDSNEYLQHTITLKKIEKTSLNYRHLFPGRTPWLTLGGLYYQYLEQFSMVPKMFEPLKFDCNKKDKRPWLISKNTSYYYSIQGRPVVVNFWLGSDSAIPLQCSKFYSINYTLSVNPSPAETGYALPSVDWFQPLLTKYLFLIILFDNPLK